MSLNTGGIYFSSEEFQPETTPLESLTKLTAGYGIIGGALYASTRYRFDKSSDRGITAFDLAQKYVRNAMENTPFSVGNTFRLAEYMSPFMSGAGKGLTFDAAGQFFYENFSFDYIDGNKGSRELLKSVLGEESYRKVQDELLGDFDNSFLQYRQSKNVHSKGEYYLMRGTGEQVRLGEGSLFLRGYSGDAFDVLLDKGSRSPLNPATGGMLQGLGFYESLDNVRSDIERTFTREVIDPDTGKVTREASRFLPGPAVSGKIESLDDLRRSAAVLSAPLNAGIQRFNKLLSATANQIPLAGSFFGGMADTFGLSMKTTPGPFYKQFFQFGVNAAKIGSVYAGIRTLDHYRREGGIFAHLGISYGIALGAQKIFDRSPLGTEALKGNNRLGIGLFAAQMLPGFSEGIKEGIFSTAANLDILKSYAGMFTGLSYYRRTVEGLLPGFTDPTVGAAFGLGLAVASGMDLGKIRLGKGKEPILPEFLRERIGFVDDIESFSFAKRYGVFKQEQLYKSIYTDAISTDILPPGKVELGMSKYHPLYESIAGLDDFNKLRAVQDYGERVRNFLNIEGHESFEDLSREQRKKLRSVLSQEFAGDIHPNRPEALGRISDYFFKLSEETRSRYFEQTVLEDEVKINATKNVDLNTALLKRLKAIDAKYEGADGFANKFMRKLEMFGAQTYHAYFGASMEGAAFDKELKNLDIRLPFRRFGSLFAGGFLAHQFFTGSLFGSLDDPSELQDIYYGGKNVEVKSGRYWEAGGTPFKGLETEYLRPHLYHLMMSRANEKSVWGDDDSLDLTQ